MYSREVDGSILWDHEQEMAPEVSVGSSEWVDDSLSLCQGTSKLMAALQVCFFKTNWSLPSSFKNPHLLRKFILIQDQ